jgi:uncharacterized protein (TIGR02001 family)
MKKLSLAIAAVLLSAGSALAADLPAKMYTKAPVVAAPVVPVWDVAMGGALSTDYVLRGISQSDNKFSVSGYFEPRWNFAPNWQAYAGLLGFSLSPLLASAEVDAYFGVRPTFGPVTFDVGFVYYLYPSPVAPIPSGGLDFYEFYVKPTWTVNDWLTLGVNFQYSPDRFMNVAGAPALDEYYVSGTAKFALPATIIPAPFGSYISGEFGRQYYDNGSAFAFNVDYNFWNVGIGFTYKIATLDIRYFDTDLSTAQCALNAPSGRGNACDSRVVARLAFDLTFDNLT